jgi:hypothetical protein
VLWNIIAIDLVDVSEWHLSKIAKVGRSSEVVDFGTEYAFAAGVLHTQSHTTCTCKEIDKPEAVVSQKSLSSAWPVWESFLLRN